MGDIDAAEFEKLVVAELDLLPDDMIEIGHYYGLDDEELQKLGWG